MSTDKYTQISVSEEFVSVIEAACSESGVSFLSFIKLSVMSMSMASKDEKMSAVAKLNITEGHWSKSKVKKTIRLTPSFKEAVVDKLKPEFNNNASLMYRASALRMATMKYQIMKSEIMTALEESIRQDYRITIR